MTLEMKHFRVFCPNLYVVGSHKHAILFSLLADEDLLTARRFSVIFPHGLVQLNSDLSLGNEKCKHFPDYILQPSKFQK